MLAICGSCDDIFFIDAAVTERFLQTGSLRTYLKEEADLGNEAGGKLLSVIIIGFGSKSIMAAMRPMALVSESALWMLLRQIGFDAHILNVLPTMWTMALAFFEQAAASPASVTDRLLKLIVEGMRGEKLTAWAAEQLLTQRTSASSQRGMRPSSACCLPPSLRWLPQRATMRLSSCPAASALQGSSLLTCTSA
eukprot:6172774-Pleurochrysis_carterae.AAC.3